MKRLHLGVENDFSRIETLRNNVTRKEKKISTKGVSLESKVILSNIYSYPWDNNSSRRTKYCLRVSKFRIRQRNFTRNSKIRKVSDFRMERRAIAKGGIAPLVN